MRIIRLLKVRILAKNKRFTIDEDKIKDNQSPYCYIEYYKGLVPIVDLLNELNRLADGNEEQLLAVMTYLHDNYYDIWEEVNKECF